MIVGTKQKTAHIALHTTAGAADVFHQQLTFEAALQPGAIPVPVQYRPAPPKNAAEFVLPRIDQTVFAFASGPAAFALTAPAELSAAQGSEVKLTVTVARTGEWTQPIDVASAVPAAELPDGITIGTAKIEKDSAELSIKTDDKAVPGSYSISLQGTLKKDKTTIVQPVPTITLTVQPPAN